MLSASRDGIHWDGGIFLYRNNIFVPGGSDRPPYFVRNIASAFFLQLGARWLAMDGA